MNNSQSNTESTNNPNPHNSPGSGKREPKTVTVAADTTNCGNDHVPNLRNKGNDADNEMMPQRCKAKITVIFKPGILNYDAVIEYTNGRIKYTDSNMRDRCDKRLQDKTNQIWSLNMVPVRKIDAELPVVNAEQPLVLPELQPLRGVPMTCL